MKVTFICSCSQRKVTQGDPSLVTVSLSSDVLFCWQGFPRMRSKPQDWRRKSWTPWKLERIHTAWWSQKSTLAPRLIPTLFPPSQTRGLWDVSVKKTTPPWFGSGFMMAKLSAARPAVPTTNWCPMSSLTNLYTYLCYYLPLLLSCVSAQCRLLFEIFLLPSERGDERSDGDVFNLRSPGKLILSLELFVYFLVLSCESLSDWSFDLFCHSTWSTC